MDFFPGIQFDTTVPTSATSGESLRLGGTVSDPIVSIVVFSYTDVAGQEVKFQTTVEAGRFEVLLLFNQDQVATYDGQIFMGEAGAFLPLVGRFPSFEVVEGEEAITLPTDFFEGMTLDNAVPTQIAVGEGFSFRGTVSDPTIEVLQFALTNTTGDEIRFQFNVVSGSFRKGIVFLPSQAGEYTLSVFGGPSSGSLPGRGTFFPITIQSTGSESVLLPIDIFGGILLDEPRQADFFVGQTRTISGILSDTSAEQLAVQLNRVDGSVSTQEFATVTDGRFSIITPTVTLDVGDFEILFFAGPLGGSLSFLDRFSPVSVVASQPRIALAAEQLSFPQTEVGSASTLTLALQNAGSETLTVSPGQRRLGALRRDPRFDRNPGWPGG